MWIAAQKGTGTKLLHAARGARLGSEHDRANSLLSRLFRTTTRLEGRLHDTWQATDRLASLFQMRKELSNYECGNPKLARIVRRRKQGNRFKTIDGTRRQAAQSVGRMQGISTK